MKPNDKVVCVDDSPGKGNNHLTGKPLPIKRGVVYAVERTWLNEVGHPLLSIIGINLGVVDFGSAKGWPLGFCISRFRPVSEVGHPPVAIEQPQPITA